MGSKKLLLPILLLLCGQTTLAHTHTKHFYKKHKQHKLDLDDIDDFDFDRPESEFIPVIDETEKQFGIPPKVLSALIEHESSFNEKSVNPVSRYNAVASYGLGQITLSTARDFCNIKSRKELIKGHVNIRCTARILKHHIDEYGGVPPALAAYRAGTPCKRYHLRSKRRCTIGDKQYVRGILKKLKRIRTRANMLADEDDYSG